jgi:beta-glucanase (GH16 family)
MMAMMTLCITSTVMAQAQHSSFCSVSGWEQVFVDEFDTFADSVWTKDVRGPGDSRTRDAMALAENVWVADSALVIRSDAAWNGSGWVNFTSGAVQSQHKRSFGGRTRVCVRAKLPGGGGGGRGYGIWPAHWLLPDDTTCWPCHGEVRQLSHPVFLPSQQ